MAIQKVLLNEEKVLKLMEKRGLRLEALASALDCSYSTLRNYLKGRRPPSAAALFCLCEKLGAKASEITTVSVIEDD